MGITEFLLVFSSPCEVFDPGQFVHVLKEAEGSRLQETRGGQCELRSDQISSSEREGPAAPKGQQIPVELTRPHLLLWPGDQEESQSEIYQPKFYGKFEFEMWGLILILHCFL